MCSFFVYVVCVYVCVFVCMYVYVCVCVFVNIYTYVCIMYNVLCMCICIWQADVDDAECQNFVAALSTNRCLLTLDLAVS